MPTRAPVPRGTGALRVQRWRSDQIHPDPANRSASERTRDSLCVQHYSCTPCQHGDLSLQPQLRAVRSGACRPDAATEPRVPDLRLVTLQLWGEVLREAPTSELRHELGGPDVRPGCGTDPIGEIPVHEDGPEPGVLPPV